MMTYQHASEHFAARIPARGQINSTTPFLNARGGLAVISKAFAGIGNWLIALAEASSRVKQVEALQSKSDAELADLGITRDQIVHYVFGDHFYI